MREITGIILYILAGFFMYMSSLLSFMSPDIEFPAEGRFYIISGSMLIGLVFLLSGLLVNWFRNWRHHSGIVLLSGASITAFLVMTVFFMLIDKDFDSFFPEGRETFMKLGNISTGFPVTGTMALLGMILILWHRKAGKTKG